MQNTNPQKTTSSPAPCLPAEAEPPVVTNTDHPGDDRMSTYTLPPGSELTQHLDDEDATGSPLWLQDPDAAPCPDWCYVTHEANDWGPDRSHSSRWEHRLEPSLAEPVHHERDGVHQFSQLALTVSLAQGQRETAPQVLLTPELFDADTGKGFAFTMSEAAVLGQALLDAVRLAGGGR